MTTNEETFEILETQPEHICPCCSSVLEEDGFCTGCGGIFELVGAS